MAEAVEHNERVFCGRSGAAKSAAHVTTVPTGQLTPLQVIGPHYSRRVARSREVFVRLMRRHVWCASKPNGTLGRLPISIVFGELDPFPKAAGQAWAAISLTQVGQPADGLFVGQISLLGT